MTMHNLTLDELREIPTWCALDVETANAHRDSICSIALVRVRDGRPETLAHALVRPPVLPGLPGWRTFHKRNTGIHGIDWSDVREAPEFWEVWPGIAATIGDSGALVAHNASFDRSALERACEHWDLPPPELPWLCTSMLARRLWGLRPSRLPDVCRALGIELTHHDAQSDAAAAARIALAALSGRVLQHDGRISRGARESWRVGWA